MRATLFQLADITPFLRCLWPLPITPNRMIFLSLLGYVVTALIIEKAAAYLAVSTSVPGACVVTRIYLLLSITSAALHAHFGAVVTRPWCRFRSTTVYVSLASV
jgi:hypothetical protein